MRLGQAFFLCFILFSFAAQAQEPVSVEVLLDGVPDRGGGWVLTVTVSAHADLESAELTIVPSEGLRITAGDPNWQGALPAGGERIIELSFLLTRSVPQEIAIGLKAHLKGGGTFEKKLTRKIG